MSAVGPHLPSQPLGETRLLPSTVLERVLDELAFDLGINGLRIPLHYAQKIEAINDNDDPFSINWSGFDFAKPFEIPNERFQIDPVARIEQVVLPLKRRVESRGEPFSTYVSPIYSYRAFPQHWHDPEEYAELAEACVTWLGKLFGLVPNYWVIVNEPGREFFGTHELENDIAAVGARFKVRGIPTRIQAIETSAPDPANLRGVLSDARVLPYLGLVSYHGYDYSAGRLPSLASRRAIRDIAKQFRLRTAMTEICCQPGWDGSYRHALGWARDIYWNLTEANVSVWEPLSMLDELKMAADLSGFDKVAAYYGLRQFSHYIRPGYIRLGISCSGCSTDDVVGQNVKPVAFETPSGRSVVVVINDQATAQEISLAGLPPGTYEVTGVDPRATTGATYPAQTVGSGQLLSLRLPAQGILTIVALCSAAVPAVGFRLQPKELAGTPALLLPSRVLKKGGTGICARGASALGGRPCPPSQ